MPLVPSACPKLGQQPCPAAQAGLTHSRVLPCPALPSPSPPSPCPAVLRSRASSAVGPPCPNIRRTLMSLRTQCVLTLRSACGPHCLSRPGPLPQQARVPLVGGPRPCVPQGRATSVADMRACRGRCARLHSTCQCLVATWTHVHARRSASPPRTPSLPPLPPRRSCPCSPSARTRRRVVRTHCPAWSRTGRCVCV